MTTQRETPGECRLGKAQHASDEQQLVYNAREQVVHIDGVLHAQLAPVLARGRCGAVVRPTSLRLANGIRCGECLTPRE